MNEQEPIREPHETASNPAGVTADSRAVSWLIDALIILGVVLVIFVLYQPVRVEGTSMLPLLHDNDALFINKMVYHVDQVQRGDIVVFRYPHDETKSYIKRVIALPGDTLRIDHGAVWVNGERIAEPYVPLQFEDDRSQPELTLGRDEYFVMGDHRSISSDSRDFGTVKRSLIYGKASFVVWPLDQLGSVR